MEYSIAQLAKLSGISTRTLRYYDEIGLLKPLRTASSGYRIYGKKEVDMLQQILFYRELDMELDKIKDIITDENFDCEKALRDHLEALYKKRLYIDNLIESIKTAILHTKGEIDMSDKEKFEAFKKDVIKKNEEKYGEEIREKYGDDIISASNKKFLNSTKEQHEAIEKLSEELNKKLKLAFEEGNPASPLAQEVCGLHKKWLTFYWPEYSKEAHMGLGQMYVDDPRFTAYYDKIAPGCSVFLRDALNIYCK